MVVVGTELPGRTAVQLSDIGDQQIHAEQYLTSDLFNADVVAALTPLLRAAPEVRIYDVA